MFYPSAQSTFVLHTPGAHPVGGGSGSNTHGQKQNTALKRIYYFYSGEEWQAER